MKYHYNKLVRDRIPEIIAAEGRQCGTEILDESAYRQALLTKLVEEAQEVATADSGDLVKELADLYEVADALIATFQLDREAIRTTQQKRHSERGGFTKRIKLLWTT
ncbi:MAG: nucleoside triphosphate pyrophosphohydrolase [Anaerolineae bacterium]|nr:nucleoside triphosphate pyrophosphohydrolase [Anaerolineae bacterium]